MEISDEQRDKFLTLLHDAVEVRGKGKPTYRMADEAGVSNEVLRNLLLSGPYKNLRASDLFKVIRYFKLDINQVAEMLGVPLPDPNPNPELLKPLAARFEDLEPEQQEWLLGTLDVLLRGLRRTQW